MAFFDLGNGLHVQLESVVAYRYTAQASQITLYLVGGHVLNTSGPVVGDFLTALTDFSDPTARDKESMAGLQAGLRPHADEEEVTPD